jgi:hypothetical protein
MTENTGNTGNTEFELTQPAAAAAVTKMLAELLGKEPELGAIIDNLGNVLAVLAWFTNGDHCWANIDNGKMTAPANGRGEITVELQCQTTGTVKKYQMADPISAFYDLGLTAQRCNGINDWFGGVNLPGSAGRD